MKIIYSILITILAFNLNAQICKCENELKFVIDYYEENLPGFKDNVNDNNLKFYNKFKNELGEISKKYCENKNDCFKILLNFVEFFKDNHSSIYQNSESIDENKKEDLDNFLNSDIYKNHEVINLNKLPNNKIEILENEYENIDETYKVAIIKSNNSFRDYVGIITNSKTAMWTKGQVKFELKKVSNNTYDMYLYLRNHSIKYYKNVQLKNGILNNEWFNVALKEKKSYNIAYVKELTFKEIDKDINYMYIPTFRADWYKKLNKFYQDNDSIIQSKPYLIIDVRNNGGGSDANAEPLLKYIYTKPFYGDNLDMYSTMENIRKWEKFLNEMKNDSLNYSKDIINSISDELVQMKSVPNKTFISRSKGEKTELDSMLNKPRKVAIIMNRQCASSCESLLFWAKESDKTILVGENSGGYVGYGEITSTVTPNFKFELGCTMTRYSKQREFEVIGISPKYYLSNKKDWVEQTIELLKTTLK